MSTAIRINKVLKELNISLDRAVETLSSHGEDIEKSPNTKLNQAQYDILVGEIQADKSKKEASEQVNQKVREEKEQMRAEKEAMQTPEDEAAVAEAPSAAEEAPAQEKEAKVEEPKAEAPKAEEPVVEEAPAPAKPAEEEAAEASPEKAEPVAEEKPAEKKAAKKSTAKAEEPKAEKPAAEETPKAEAPTEEKVSGSDAEKTEGKGVIKAKSKGLSGLKIQGKIELEKPKPAAKKEAKPATKAPAEKPAPAKEEKAPAAEKAAEETKATEAKAAPEAKTEEKPAEDSKITTKYEKLSGPKLTGEKIDLSQFNKPKKKVASSNEPSDADKRKRKRKRISTPGSNNQGGNQRPDNRGKRKGRPAPAPKRELTEEEVQKQIKETLEKLTGGNKKSKGSKLRRAKREERREQDAMDEMRREEESMVLKVAEFVTVTDLAHMMDVPVNKVIGSLMMLGIMVTMNQRLDGETLTIVAEEFGYTVEFVGSDVTEAIEEEEDNPEDLKPRAPIITVMGHVDHGKTSLLDYIRKANVIAGEAGGITQHIGAYSVTIENGSKITFLDTPGHEAFTAMRARGAQVTDVAIIVVAADDAVMPQTKEAISHAQAAGVPIVFALNKIDNPGANSDKIREQLSTMNILLEDWGGKVQSQEVSAKTGLGVNELLEKVLLEAEMLDLKANPDRNASGTVIEASLDKGRGYLSTILVQNGTLKIGDYVLAGQYSGKVRAMLDERGHRIEEAGPSTPVILLGLDGAPQAGDTFLIMDDEREAKQIAQRRMQLQREQSVRTQKNLTLEEIGRRLAIGDFQELNVVLKGDVDGSVEALSDSLQKLSTDQIQVNIIHKAVGQISEGDILLAAASDAIIVGFQVRPSGSARKLAEKEEVDIRLYSIIYDAINEIKDAMEGMLSPDVKEVVTCNLEVRETFKISKVGTIAGCMVMDGTIKRNTSVRLIRDGVVIYTGGLGSLKRFKDDVKEVSKGYDCGLNITNFNDVKVGDVIEGFEEIEVKKTLD
jgi:translation initiation factor IF-2